MTKNGWELTELGLFIVVLLVVCMNAKFRQGISSRIFIFFLGLLWMNRISSIDHSTVLGCVEWVTGILLGQMWVQGSWGQSTGKLHTELNSLLIVALEHAFESSCLYASRDVFNVLVRSILMISEIKH